MTKRISSAEAKAKLSEIVGRVAHGGERYVIERRGKPMAAIVPVEDLERLDGEPARRPKGILGLVGGWSALTDEEIDKFIEDIYESRARDLGRPVDLS